MGRAAAVLLGLSLLALTGCLGKSASGRASESAGHLRAGMTKQEVAAILGKPVTAKAEGNREVWYYPHSSTELVVCEEEEDKGEPWAACLVITFAGGRVTEWTIV